MRAMNTGRTFGVLLVGWVLALAGVGFVAPGLADDRVPDGNLARGMITPEAQRAIEDGLKYLASQQADNGSFGTRQFQGNVAITRPCGPALPPRRHQPGRGKDGR